ncbi:MAG: hypothetical protein MRY78_07615 [Saprospiraceae bacterium]|nr:hypothetical protein [Saprospiraceae bacterium]
MAKAKSQESAYWQIDTLLEYTYLKEKVNVKAYVEHLKQSPEEAYYLVYMEDGENQMTTFCKCKEAGLKHDLANYGNILEWMLSDRKKMLYKVVDNSPLASDCWRQTSDLTIKQKGNVIPKMIAGEIGAVFEIGELPVVQSDIEVKDVHSKANNWIIPLKGKFKEDRKIYQFAPVTYQLNSIVSSVQGNLLEQRYEKWEQVMAQAGFKNVNKGPLNYHFEPPILEKDGQSWRSGIRIEAFAELRPDEELEIEGQFYAYEQKDELVKKTTPLWIESGANHFTLDSRNETIHFSTDASEQGRSQVLGYFLPWTQMRIKRTNGEIITHIKSGVPLKEANFPLGKQDSLLVVEIEYHKTERLAVPFKVTIDAAALLKKVEVPIEKLKNPKIVYAQVDNGQVEISDHGVRMELLWPLNEDEQIIRVDNIKMRDNEGKDLMLRQAQLAKELQQQRQYVDGERINYNRSFYQYGRDAYHTNRPNRENQQLIHFVIFDRPVSGAHTLFAEADVTVGVPGKPETYYRKHWKDQIQIRQPNLECEPSNALKEVKSDEYVMPYRVALSQPYPSYNRDTRLEAYFKFEVPDSKMKLVRIATNESKIKVITDDKGCNLKIPHQAEITKRWEQRKYHSSRIYYGINSDLQTDNYWHKVYVKPNNGKQLDVKLQLGTLLSAEAKEVKGIGEISYIAYNPDKKKTAIVKTELDDKKEIILEIDEEKVAFSRVTYVQGSAEGQKIAHFRVNTDKSPYIIFAIEVKNKAGEIISLSQGDAGSFDILPSEIAIPAEALNEPVELEIKYAKLESGKQEMPFRLGLGL